MQERSTGQLATMLRASDLVKRQGSGIVYLDVGGAFSEISDNAEVVPMGLDVPLVDYSSGGVIRDVGPMVLPGYRYWSDELLREQLWVSGGEIFQNDSIEASGVYIAEPEGVGIVSREKPYVGFCGSCGQVFGGKSYSGRPRSFALRRGLQSEWLKKFMGFSHGVGSVVHSWDDLSGAVGRVRNCSDYDQVLSLLRAAGVEVVVERLGYLREVIEDDPEEVDIQLDSLKVSARFFLAERQLATDRLSVDSQGRITAEWPLSPSGVVETVSGYGEGASGYWGGGDGLLVMVFLPNGWVRYAANSGPPGAGVDRLRCGGTFPVEMVLGTLGVFVPSTVST